MSGKVVSMNVCEINCVKEEIFHGISEIYDLLVALEETICAH